MTKKEIWALSDEGLVTALEDLFGRRLGLSAWEENFVEGIRGFWVRTGWLSRKQQKTGREILMKLVERARRAQQVPEA